MSMTFGIKFQSRVLRSFASEEKSTWIVATNSLREENEIRVVEFDAQSETLISPAVYVHRNEVWDLALSPLTPTEFITAHNSGTQFGLTLWKTEASNEALTKISDIGHFEKRIERIRWHEHTGVMTLEDTKIKQWDIQEETPTEMSCGVGQDLDQFSSMQISNTDPNMLFLTNGQGYQVWDLREMKMQESVNYAHEMPLRNIDIVNNTIATCGDDCSVKIWDSRNLGKVVVELTGHSHWVWDCAFNRTHPSLLLSASSDASVILWDIRSSLSEPLSESPRSVTDEVSDDRKACSYTDHDESVYCVSWSAADEWIFASLSYDGRLVVNKVPSEIKYKILI